MTADERLIDPYADYTQVWVDGRSPEEGGKGDDANDGRSPEKPKRTIQAAAGAGVCVNYVGDLDIDPLETIADRIERLIRS